MQLENSKKSVKINKIRYIAIISFIVIVIVLVTTDLIREAFLGLNKYHWAVIVTLLYILENIYEYLKDFNYIYYSDEGEKIIFRYVSLRPFQNKRYSIEMNKANFIGYKVVRSPLNFKQQIIFYVKTPNGSAKYPPVSITGLSTDQFNSLKHALNQFQTQQV